MFNSPNDFSMYIEKRAMAERNTLTDTVLAYCDEHSLDPADIKELVNQSLKAKLAVEFRSMGMMPSLATIEDL